MIKEAVLEILEENIGIKGDEAESFYEFYSKLPYFKEDMEVRRDNVLFVYVSMYLSEIQYKKEGSYGNSWEKRKEVGVFMNLARKFDRLEGFIVDGKSDEVGETKIDTVGDTANYGVLWATYLLRTDPAGFKNWLKNNF